MRKFYFKIFKIKRRKPKTRRKLSANFLKHKEQAREIVLQRLEHFNQHYNLTFGRISIRNQRRRWGSCSSKGNLNFNYRIATLPSHLSDYIIVHELCHRGQFNHSQKFWDLVGETLPNYEALQVELKKIRI